MRTFSAIVTMMSRSKPVTYKLSVYPVSHHGEVSSIDIETYGDFASALGRMGIEGESLRDVICQLESGQSVSHRNFTLTEPNATFFGCAAK